MDKNVVIPFKTVLLTLITGILLYIVYKLWSIIGIVFLAILISISLEHSIKYFIGRKLFGKNVNRPIAVSITYALVFMVFATLLVIGFDPVVTQYDRLIKVLGQYQNGFSFFQDIELSLSELISGFITTTGGVISATSKVLSNLASLLTILILSIYISLDWENLKTGIAGLFNEKNQKDVTTTIGEIESTVGHWLSGQLFLMLVIGISTYISLIVLDVDFPLALGLLAGVLEIVPFFGPIVTALITILVAPSKAVFIIILFIIIQQVESNILVPKVMQKVSGFSPLVILLAILIGSNLFGLMGAVIAVPTLMIGYIILKKLL